MNPAQDPTNYIQLIGNPKNEANPNPQLAQMNNPEDNRNYTYHKNIFILYRKTSSFKA
jgi:hypothetical protein